MPRNALSHADIIFRLLTLILYSMPSNDHSRACYSVMVVMNAAACLSAFSFLPCPTEDQARNHKTSRRLSGFVGACA